MVTAELFRQVPLFSGLEDEDLSSLISVASRRKYPKDAVVFFENDLGDALYMILSGRVKVTILSDDGREIILSMLSEHEFFGEMSLLDDEPRSATAIALAETEILVLHQRDFLSIVEKRPRVLVKLLSVLSSRLAKPTNKSAISRSTTCMGASRDSFSRWRAKTETGSRMAASCFAGRRIRRSRT